MAQQQNKQFGSIDDTKHSNIRMSSKRLKDKERDEAKKLTYGYCKQRFIEHLVPEAIMQLILWFFFVLNDEFLNRDDVDGQYLLFKSNTLRLYNKCIWNMLNVTGVTAKPPRPFGDHYGCREWVEAVGTIETDPDKNAIYEWNICVEKSMDQSERNQTGRPQLSTFKIGVDSGKMLAFNQKNIDQVYMESMSLYKKQCGVVYDFGSGYGGIGKIDYWNDDWTNHSCRWNTGPKLKDLDNQIISIEYETNTGVIRLNGMELRISRCGMIIYPMKLKTDLCYHLYVALSSLCRVTIKDFTIKTL